MFDSKIRSGMVIAFVVILTLGSAATVAALSDGVDSRSIDGADGPSAQAAQPTQTQTGGTGTESEPNDDPGSANPIESGARIQGAVSSPDDLDAFTLNAGESDTIRAELSRTSGQGLLALVVYNSEAEFVSGVIAEPGETTRLSAPVNRSERYDVVVASASQFGVEGPGSDGVGEYALSVETRSVGGPIDDFGTTTGVETAGTVTTSPTTEAGPATDTRTTPTAETTSGSPFELTETASAPGASESEPNDDPSAANPIRLGAPVDASIGSTDDLDWYRVDVPAGETLKAELSRGAGAGSFVYIVFGPDGEPLTGARVNASETVEVTADATQSGTYYVGVSSSSANPGTGEYRLTVQGSALEQGPPEGPGFQIGDEDPTTTATAGGPSDPNEPNDDPNSATGLSPGAPVSGAVAGDDDLDAFAVQMRSGTSYTFTLSRPSASGTLGISLVRPDGSLVDINGQPIYRTSFVDTDVTYTANQTGTHYLVVTAGTGSGPYTVSVTEGSSSGAATTSANDRSAEGAVRGARVVVPPAGASGAAVAGE